MTRFTGIPLVLLVVMAAHFWGGPVGLVPDVQASEGGQYETITLKVEGMTCGGCVKDVHAALLTVPGVLDADVTIQPRSAWWKLFEVRDGEAVVACEKGTVDVDQLVQTIEAASAPTLTYKATVVDQRAGLPDTVKP